MADKKVHVLRLSHRAQRDKRVTTHIGLVARAFGAEKMIVTGARDKHLDESIGRIVEFWGGPFSIEFCSDSYELIDTYKNNGFLIVHLTMYGLPILEQIDSIRKATQDVLVIVGGEKVPFEIYQAADYNIAVGSQPHSEISALSVFLDRLFGGAELSSEFKDARRKIVPQACGKRLVED